MPDNILLWVGFNVLVLVLLALDLGVFHRESHVIKMREALIQSAFWIALALVFNVVVYFWRGTEVALEFLAGYVIERSLSVDNLFVFLVIFSYFKVPEEHQYKALIWGILGALIMRAVFIAAGITLIERFHWIIYIFGAFLIITGIRMALSGDEDIQPEKNPVLRLLRRYLPITQDYHEDKFFIRRAGQLFATPLFVVLVVIETTDVVFALDSIPAVLAITLDPFIVYTSNVFAIIGLRALYFALAGIMQLFHFLSYGLSAVLVFVGVKMVIADIYKIPVGIALAVVALLITVSIVASIIWPENKDDEASPAKSELSGSTGDI